MSPVPVILYRYDPSPFCTKIDNVLALKKVPHERVTISPVLPRPELADYLGVNYRRAPILAIGNDVYCDTSAITTALERRFPSSQGYGTIFPKSKHGGGKHTGMVKAFAKSYAEGALLDPAISLISWENIPEAFIKDRSEALLEEQLSDEREWLFDTESPSLADICVHFMLSWIKNFRGTEVLFNKKQNPFVNQWLDRMSNIVKENASQNISTNLSGRDAANKILASTHESYDVVGFDLTEATRLAVAAGDSVQITPIDTGRTHPTTGKLVALSREEFVLEVVAPDDLVRCHFPRIGFSIKVANPPEL